MITNEFLETLEKNMNILIIQEVDWIKKITYEMHHLSELFSIKGHNVFAIDIPDPGLFNFSKKIFQTVYNYNRIYEKASVTLFRTPILPFKGLSRLSAYFSSYYFIKKILKQNKIDIVLIYSGVNNLEATIKATKEMNIPLIHRTFDIAHLLILEKYLKNRVEKIEKKTYPQIEFVLANTPFMKEWTEKMGAKNVHVISQGVDSSILTKMKPNSELMKELGISKTDFVVMYLGSVGSHSGLESILKHTPEILKKFPSFKLLIVGDGPFLHILKQISNELKISKNIIFTGFVPYTKISSYCSLAKLCINPFQINEMTDKLSPAKIFDMMACGKPILATPLKGMLYDFPSDSNTIIYSELEHFGTKIIELLDRTDLENIGNKTRDYVKMNYSWNTVAEKMLEIFSNIKNHKTF